MFSGGEAKLPCRSRCKQVLRTSPARNAVQRLTSVPSSIASALSPQSLAKTRERLVASHVVLQRTSSPTREGSPPRLRSSPPRKQPHSPPQWHGLVAAAASVGGSRISLRPRSPPQSLNANAGSLEAPPQRRAPLMRHRSNAIHGCNGRYTVTKPLLSEVMSAQVPQCGAVLTPPVPLSQASQCSTSLTPLPASLSQVVSCPSESEASGATSIQTLASSSTRPPNIADESDVNAFAKLQELSKDRESLVFSLGEVFAAVDRGNLGHILRDDAVLVLRRTFALHLASFPSACAVDEAELLRLLKTFGVYGPDDAIDFQMLVDLCMRKIASLRDLFASRGALRAMSQVSRGAPRLKDQYDKFEFYSKDSLGKVYICHDTCTLEVRSCRQIRKDKATLPMDQVRTSLARLMEIHHTGMPQVHGFVEDFRNFYILSALAPGVEVMDRIQDALQQNQILTEAWVAGIIRQVLEVLAWCYSQSTGPVMHGDLKPDNVLLTAEDKTRVSITSIGLQALFNAQPLEKIWSQNDSQALPSSGLPEIFAPEVWKRDAGPKCDVWSCGCLLFLLVTGSLPFGPELALPNLAHMIIKGEPDWRLFRHVSTGALSLCRRMLSRDEILRPSARECLRHPWFGSCSRDYQNSRELRLDTFSSLMNFQTRVKLHQVLMNLVAAELKVSDLQRLPTVFASYDASRIGLLTCSEFEEALKELGAMPESALQVLHALIPDRQSKVPYEVFVAGCADLVDDKLDHMLWKVFSMVDEDCSGEVGTIELEHFLSATSAVDCDERDNATNGQAGGSHGGVRKGSRSPATDLERYLRGVLPPDFDAVEAVARMARGHDFVAFEDLKSFVLEGAAAF